MTRGEYLNINQARSTPKTKKWPVKGALCDDNSQGQRVMKKPHERS